MKDRKTKSTDKECIHNRLFRIRN